MGVPVVVMGMPGRARRCRAPARATGWPRRSSRRGRHGPTCSAAASRGGRKTHDGRRDLALRRARRRAVAPAPAGDRRRRVLVLSGRGGTEIGRGAARRRAPRDARTGTWTVLGPPGDRWVADPWPLLCAADVVVTHAGQNAIADVAAAAARPSSCRRPGRTASRHATAAALRRRAAGHRLRRLARRPRLAGGARSAAARRGRGLGALDVGHGAADAPPTLLEDCCCATFTDGPRAHRGDHDRGGPTRAPRRPSARRCGARSRPRAARRRGDGRGRGGALPGGLRRRQRRHRCGTPAGRAAARRRAQRRCRARPPRRRRAARLPRRRLHPRPGTPAPLRRRGAQRRAGPALRPGRLPPPATRGGYPLTRLAALARAHPARPVPAEDALETGGDHALFWTLSFAVTAATWRRIGGFCEDYVGYGGEDTDYGQLARRAGVDLAWVGGAWAFHQHHPTATPPVQHLDDILRNAAIFKRRWGWWPMAGWLAEFACRGLARHDPAADRWHAV